MAKKHGGAASKLKAAKDVYGSIDKRKTGMTANEAKRKRMSQDMNETQEDRRNT